MRVAPIYFFDGKLRCNVPILSDRFWRNIWIEIYLKKEKR